MARCVLFTAIALTAGLTTATACADPAPGERLYRHCSSCHGPDGRGGENGRYPRIAGLPEPYLLRQLEAFKTGKRRNKPMLPVFRDWRFDSAAMAAVAAHVAQLPGDLRPPRQAPSAEALERFDSREEFLATGAELFRDCAQCHGDDGRGRADKETPPLAGQYPAYLARQMDDFAAGRRPHEHAATLFGELYPEEREALLAHIQDLPEQGRPGAPGQLPDR
jgi:cytochrome c553